MKAVREICVAGSVIDVTLKISKPREKKKRSHKSNITPDDVWKVNKRNAEKTLARILNHNFVPGDWHLVFTYQGEEPTKKKAKADREKLTRQLSKDGLKWVAVTEYMHERIHHHIVVSFMPFEYFINLWQLGDVRPTPMKRDRNYKRLAHYFIKETSKSYQEENSCFKRRYSCSRTVTKPEVRREEIRVSDIYQDPKPLKGYYIDEKTVRRYNDMFTGMPCVEYYMVSMEKKPRVKKWYKGTKILREQNYNRLLRNCEYQEQLSLSI